MLAFRRRATHPRARACGVAVQVRHLGRRSRAVRSRDRDQRLRRPAARARPARRLASGFPIRLWELGLRRISEGKRTERAFSARLAAD